MPTTPAFCFLSTEMSDLIDASTVESTGYVGSLPYSMLQAHANTTLYHCSSVSPRGDAGDDSREQGQLLRPRDPRPLPVLA